MPIKYSDISSYWSENPCAGGDKKFPFSMCRAKRVLEIGCGAGVDAKRFIDAGAIYTGIDLTERACYLTRTRIKGVGKIIKMNAEFLEFPDETFDLVYSFGVIHHAVTPINIIKEVHRVLRIGGLACVMLYNKPSVRYNLDIMFLRKILWHLNFYRYKELKKQNPTPSKEQWIAWNTDTLGCPVAKVYSKEEVDDLFKIFKAKNVRTDNFGWFRKIVAEK